MKVKNRVKSHQEFQKVIENGLLERTNCLNLYYLKNDLGYPRVGISVPTKSGNAVIRNKIKRQIRAIIAHELIQELSFDLIFVARKRFNIKDFSTSENEVRELLKKVGCN